MNLFSNCLKNFISVIKVEKSFFIVFLFTGLYSCRQNHTVAMVTNSFGDPVYKLYRPVLDSLNYDYSIDYIGGSCISSGTNYAQGDGVNRVPYIDRIENALAKHPKILIIGDIQNDAHYNVDLGDTNSTATTTVYGALKFIANKILADTGIKHVLFIGFPQRNTIRFKGKILGDSNYTADKKFDDAVTWVCKKNAFVKCDVFENSWPYNQSAAFTRDGAHPNACCGAPLLNNLFSKSIIEASKANIHP